MSHLEFENQQLKKRTAKLEQESRSMENRLVQEQIDNGDLTARLDDARNLLRDRGIESDVKLGSRRPRDDDDRFTDEGENSRGRTTPAGRTARQRRKPPFAQISAAPGNARSADDDEGGSAADSRRARDTRAGRPRRRSDDDLDRHSSRDDSQRWLPVANASGDPTIEIR